jgi:hypothetical protein
VHRAVVWATNYAAVVAAGMIRPAPALYFPGLGCLLVNHSILPERKAAAHYPLVAPPRNHAAEASVEPL